jgi:hypothetical protein
VHLKLAIKRSKEVSGDNRQHNHDSVFRRFLTGGRQKIQLDGTLSLVFMLLTSLRAGALASDRGYLCRSDPSYGAM